MGRIYGVIAVWAAWVAVLQGQDIHFSQFYQAPLQINPALAGAFDGNFRVAANFRDQWFTVPVPYMTIKLGGDAKLLPQRIEHDMLGAGLMVYHDQAGDNRMSTLYFAGNLGFHKKVVKNFYIGAGLMLGYAQRRIQKDKMTFDDQFNGDVFDPSIQSADLANITSTQYGYFDLGFGFNFKYQHQHKRRMFWDAGISLYHVHQPKASFMNYNLFPSKLREKWIWYFSGSFMVHPRWDVLPHLMVQLQYPYSEAIVGALAKYHLNVNPGRETALLFGAKYRSSHNDAVVPTLGFSYQSCQFGVSYDVNVSKFVPATANNGAIELSFVYIWRSVPKLPTIKICPIM